MSYEAEKEIKINSVFTAVKNSSKGDWRDGLLRKITHCSCRSGLNFLYPHGGSQSSVTLI